MKKAELLIHNATGLHARPAKVFVAAAKQFESEIRVQHGNKRANAKSMISMLTLGVEQGGRIRIMAKGVDEAEALAALTSLVESGLGEGPEGDHAPTPAAKPAEPVAKQPEAVLGENVVQGIPAAPGVVIGPVFQWRVAAVEVEETFADISTEKNRLQTAIEQARAQLTVLRRRMAKRSGQGEAAIFEVHLELLDDPDLLDGVLAKIDGQQSAARAWQSTIDARADMVAKLNDPLLAARSADLHDVGYRVLRLLVGAGDAVPRLPDQPVVIIGHELTPSDTASLDRQRVLGFCTAVGGPTAHAAIIARALALPAVVSAGSGVLDIPNGTLVILDGVSGTLRVAPDEAAQAAARAKQQRLADEREAAARSAVEPAVTRDGHRVEVVANVGGVADAVAAEAAGAEGVGLLRTEFLFLERTAAPTEEEQYAVYRDIVKAMKGQPVIVRTLDIGGDKPLPYIDVPDEENPFLGERGIRLCLNRPELLRQQLRAVLRAATAGPLRIMFPMVSDITEWRRARAMVEGVRAELDAPPVELGIMIEVPSAALMADMFAPEVDFFSVGTNDLTQYTLAMDRQHPVLAKQADGLHPAVLRLIKQTVDAAHAHGKWTGVCGELGADPQAIPLLIGLGVDELSVSVPAIAAAKAQIRTLTLAEAQAAAQRALKCATAAEVRALTPQQED